MSKIVIIGAGIAGISAAGALFKAGFSDVTILEAQDYVGGRIKSIPFGSSTIELGAEYIHGADGNPIYQLALENDWLNEEEKLLTDEDDLDDMEFRNFNGTLVENEVAYKIIDILGDVQDHLLYKKNMRKAPEQRLTYGDLCDLVVEDYLKKKRKISDEAKAVQRRIYKWWKENECNDIGTESLSDVSLNEVECYHWCPGYQYNALTTSYSAILDLLSVDLPKSAFKLLSPVSRIHWQNETSTSNQSIDRTEKKVEMQNEGQGEYPVTIDCEGGETYSADHVIMTASLGFMQNNIGAMFHPTLPQNKISAFQNLSFGNTVKLFLQFDKPLMDHDFMATQFMWPADKPVALQTARTSIKLKNGREWYECFVSCDPQKDETVLLFWMNGEAAGAIDSIPEQELKEVCQEILQKFLGRSDITLPTTVIKSDWCKNKYVCGTYSYMGRASKPEHRRELSKPEPSEENPVLIFAGEAVSMHHFSTAHGALETGIDAATKIIHMHKSKQE